MKIERAKQVLLEEVNNPSTDLHDPLSNKYAQWKILDYLWACFFDRKLRSEGLDWLKETYSSHMSEEELQHFCLQLSLLASSMNRLLTSEWKEKINL